MTTVPDFSIESLGVRRVIEPAGALPQTAWKLDNASGVRDDELLCAVETLNIDSASFKQISDVCGGDPQRIGAHIASTVRERGKQHNPVTGSGGMFVGTVSEIGTALSRTIDLRPGDRVASLVSLTLTPLRIDEILHVDTATGRVRIRGNAILFASSLWAKLPTDIDSDVALAVLDVAGAPAQVRRMTKPAMTVVIIGADGKSGLLSCAQAKTMAGARGRVIAVAPDAHSRGARVLRDAALVDDFIEADARDAIATFEGVSRAEPGLADLVVNCVNVPGTEMSSILCAKQRGVVYFFSMATSFTAAALGAEGAGKDVTMVIGNGYTRGHAQTALQTLRDHPPLRAHFDRTYSSEPVNKEPS